MSTEPRLYRRSGDPRPAARTAILIALFAIAPFAAIADQHAATAPDTRVADVPLADLDLSTPEGMRVASERLHTMAQRVCSQPADNRGLSSQPNFVACVDGTLAVALRQINALRQIKVTTRHSVTRAANVSLADLDLSTLEGSRAARERLEAMARRLCAELARSNDLSYQPNYGACVHDTLAGALAQVNALAAAKESRIARRSAP
ncbi:MAG TPA: UrcA family protein [Steroidobacteraceae bacterium]|nr:UrcA family protein [Steroidobacteraceae bacterium]